jgi:hypothetical protein
VKLTSLAGIPRLLVLALAFGVTFVRPSQAQPSITSVDIQRLQDAIYDASRDVAQAGSRDRALSSQLQAELDDARDEVTYLKVKVRRNEPIAQSELVDLRDRIENIRARARGDSAGGYTPPPGTRTTPDRSEGRDRSGARVTADEVPAGTEFDVRLTKTLSSATAQVEDRFEATTAVDLRDDRGRAVVPAGSIMRGIVSSVTKATRVERTGKLTLTFDRITIDSRSYPIRATVEQALESEGIRGETGRIGIGAGAGAILGAILGGAKGALAGILIGAGGTIAATEGKDVELPAGTVLRVRLDTPIDLRR